jgi:hypothetical protein
MTVEEALNALPADADQIADLFLQQGITGTRYWPTCCPLAVYLKGVAQPCSVSAHYVKTFTSPVRVIDNPDHVREFVKRFDKLMYPDLVE